MSHKTAKAVRATRTSAAQAASASPDNTTIPRDANGRWLKGGPSPNPNGKPARAHEIREAFQAVSLEALARLKQLMYSEDSSTAVQACRVILDRAWGRPEQAITLAPAVMMPIAPVVDATEAARVYAIVCGDPNADLSQLKFDTAPPQLEQAPNSEPPVLPVLTAPSEAELLPVEPNEIKSRVDTWARLAK